MLNKVNKMSPGFIHIDINQSIEIILDYIVKSADLVLESREKKVK